jgi:hypothetical protein
MTAEQAQRIMQALRNRQPPRTQGALIRDAIEQTRKSPVQRPGRSDSTLKEFYDYDSPPTP